MDHIYYFVQSNLLSFQIHSFPALSAILPHSIHFNFYNLYRRGERGWENREWMNGEWENGEWGTWDGKSRIGNGEWGIFKMRNLSKRESLKGGIFKTENLLKRGVNFILRFKNRPNV